MSFAISLFSKASKSSAKAGLEMTVKAAAPAKGARFVRKFLLLLLDIFITVDDDDRVGIEVAGTVVNARALFPPAMSSRQDAIVMVDRHMFG